MQLAKTFFGLTVAIQHLIPGVLMAGINPGANDKQYRTEIDDSKTNGDTMVAVLSSPTPIPHR